jgi:hypothetical protein
MNKPLSVAEFEAMQVPNWTVMSKKEKIIKWASLVYNHSRRIRMLHDLEYMTPEQLRTVDTTDTIYSIAGKDPALQAAGLAGTSVSANKEFFNLSSNELHHISCDCLGELENYQMAKRIGELAG